MCCVDQLNSHSKLAVEGVVTDWRLIAQSSPIQDESLLLTYISKTRS